MYALLEFNLNISHGSLQQNLREDHMNVAIFQSAILLMGLPQSKVYSTQSITNAELKTKIQGRNCYDPHIYFELQKMSAFLYKEYIILMNRLLTASICFRKYNFCL